MIILHAKKGDQITYKGKSWTVREAHSEGLMLERRVGNGKIILQFRPFKEIEGSGRNGSDNFRDTTPRIRRKYVTS